MLASAHRWNTRLPAATSFHRLRFHSKCQPTHPTLRSQVAGRFSNSWNFNESACLTLKHKDTVDFATALAGSQSQEAPPLLTGSTFCAWLRRWMRMLSISRARSPASSLVLTKSHRPECQGGWARHVAELIQFSSFVSLLHLLTFQLSDWHKKKKRPVTEASRQLQEPFSWTVASPGNFSSI